MSDPRLLVIPKRLMGVKHIIPVMSSKGGVGKTLISTVLSLISADNGYRTGLLDLDFTNPSTHIVLGIEPDKLEIIEEKGVIPPTVYGVKYMSIALYSGDNPLPLRGEAVSEAFREILAITRWGDLDYLFIDTPPGISDEHLELLTYLGDRIEALLVATPSPLSIKSVERLIELLVEGKYRINGLIENMSDTRKLVSVSKKYNIRYLGNIPYYHDLDNIIGNIEKIKNSDFWKTMVTISKNIFDKNS